MGRRYRMEGAKPIIHFAIGGFNIDITMSIIEQWIVMAIIIILVLILKNLNTQ
jgi:hypothetical protein